MVLYMLEVGLAGDKIGNHPNHPYYAAMQPPAKDGPERSQWRCGLIGFESAHLW
jgi:hypothetical protein